MHTDIWDGLSHFVWGILGTSLPHLWVSAPGKALCSPSARCPALPGDLQESWMFIQVNSLESSSSSSLRGTQGLFQLSEQSVCWNLSCLKRSHFASSSSSSSSKAQAPCSCGVTSGRAVQMWQSPQTSHVAGGVWKCAAKPSLKFLLCKCLICSQLRAWSWR